MDLEEQSILVKVAQGIREVDVKFISGQQTGEANATVSRSLLLAPADAYDVVTYIVWSTDANVLEAWLTVADRPLDEHIGASASQTIDHNKYLWGIILKRNEDLWVNITSGPTAGVISYRLYFYRFPVSP